MSRGPPEPPGPGPQKPSHYFLQVPIRRPGHRVCGRRDVRCNLPGARYCTLPSAYNFCATAPCLARLGRLSEALGASKGIYWKLTIDCRARLGCSIFEVVWPLLESSKTYPYPRGLAGP